VDLTELGWNEALARAFAPWQEQGLRAGRVIRAHRGTWDVQMGDEVLTAKVPGSTWKKARSARDLPAVGDWVAVKAAEGRKPLIRDVLPRTSVFTRKAAGGREKEQVIAANVDTVFVLMGLDTDFSARRLERYLTATREAGSEPVVLLNKLDLCEDPQPLIEEARRVAGQATVELCSALSPDTLDLLQPWLIPQATICLLGSSGVGKSTLTNLLLGERRQQTGAVRDKDRKGRHTTTHRELVLLPSEALLIDTPGMRELGLWEASAGLDETFPEVRGLLGGCRWRDCGHGEDEQGCALWGAVREGEVARDRLEAFLSLTEEVGERARKREEAIRKVRKGRRKKR
jgi:ribosome biogenesis GTPase